MTHITDVSTLKIWEYWECLAMVSHQANSTESLVSLSTSLRVMMPT